MNENEYADFVDQYFDVDEEPEFNEDVAEYGWPEATEGDPS